MRCSVAVITSVFLLYFPVSAHAQIDSAHAPSTVDSATCRHYFDLGTSYMTPRDRTQKPDYESAAFFYEKTIACDSSRFSAYVNAAACYLIMKKTVRGGQLLDNLLALKPDLEVAHHWKANYFRTVDSLEKARTEDSLAHEPVHGPPITVPTEGGAALQLTWGQALLELLDPNASDEEYHKKIEEAVSHFRKAVTMEPKNAKAHLWLAHGLVLSGSEGRPGHPKEACREYRIALKLDPGNADAKKGIQRLGCVWLED